jgi:hypothetical protein
MQDLIICHILYIDKKLENINPKHHIPNDSDIVPQELVIDIKHVHPKLEGLLLAKVGISNLECKFSICKTSYIPSKLNKMPKLALANGLWIGVPPTMLPKLTMVKETLIAQYHSNYTI